MYIVHNLTTKTVILADLRAEIGPKKILDLELITHRDIIERSRDLQVALSSSRLRLVKYSAIKTHAHTVEKTKIVETNKIDEERLRDIVRQTIAEEIKKVSPPESDVEGTIKRVLSGSVQDLHNSIRDQINSIQIHHGKEQPDQEESFIDPDKLAELQQKSISKIVGSIKTGGNQEGKKIKIINTNTNIDDLASEL